MAGEEQLQKNNNYYDISYMYLHQISYKNYGTSITGILTTTHTQKKIQVDDY